MKILFNLFIVYILYSWVMFFVDVNNTYAEKMYTIAYTKYITQPPSEFKVNQNF
jgi:hypothetical protein